MHSVGWQSAFWRKGSVVMVYMIGVAILAIAWCVMILLLAIFRWDWLGRHPRLYLDRLGIWRDAEYDPKIRIKTIIKFAVFIALECVLIAVLVNNYMSIRKLADYTEVNAGEALPLAGGELVFSDRVEGNEITIVRNNARTGQYGNYIVSADTRDYKEALVAFTGIFTNTTDQTLIISGEDIKMSGVPTEVERGYKFNGSWAADHKVDGNGNVELAPGESAFLYFWAVLNKDKQTQSYAYVVQDGENYYRLNMDSLRPVAAGELTAQNTYAAVLEAAENIEDLVYGETYYGANIGNVTLKDVWLKDAGALMDGRMVLDIVMDVESANKLWDSTLEQWMSILVLADGNICWEGAEFSIKERKDPVNEGENYSCEVHYLLFVPENVQKVQIILSMGGDYYLTEGNFE